MKKDFEKRMFAVEVKKSGFSGIYRGAGTKKEVLEDLDFLRKRGIKNEELEIKPILGRPRQVEVETMRPEDRQLFNQVLEKQRSTASAYVRGFAWGVGITSLAVGGYLLYKSSKSKNDEEKDEE